MKSRSILYFVLAVLPALLQAEHAPADAWGWWKWVGVALYQGLLAVKAYQSPAPASSPVSDPAASPWVPKP